MPGLQDMGRRRQDYGLGSEHYPMVGDALLKTVARYAEAAWTEEVEGAWVEAYGVRESGPDAGGRRRTNALRPAGARLPPSASIPCRSIGSTGVTRGDVAGFARPRCQARLPAWITAGWTHLERVP